MFSSLKRQRASLEAVRRMNQSATFTEPIHVEAQDRPAMMAFLTDFYHTIYSKQGEIQLLLQNNEQLQAHYAQLVSTKVVSYEDFWQRYYWRCDPELILAAWERKDHARKEARAKAFQDRLANVQKWADNAMHNEKNTPPSDVAHEPAEAVSREQQPSGAVVDESGSEKTEQTNAEQTPDLLHTKADEQDRDQEELLIFESSSEDSEKATGSFTEKTSSGTISTLPSPTKKEEIHLFRGWDHPSPVQDRSVDTDSAQPNMEYEEGGGSERRLDSFTAEEVADSRPPKDTRVTTETAPQSPVEEGATAFRTWNETEKEEESVVQAGNSPPQVEKSLSEMTSDGSTVESTTKAVEPHLKLPATATKQVPLFRGWDSSTPTPNRSVGSVSPSPGQNEAVNSVEILDFPKASETAKRSLSLALSVGAVLATVIATLLIPPLLSPLSIMDGLCSPAVPSRILQDEPARLEAPWWAPDPFKANAFDFFCGKNRIRTAIEWDIKKKSHDLRVLAADDEGLVLVKKQRLSSAQIFSQRVATTNLQGVVLESIPAPWVQASSK